MALLLEWYAWGIQDWLTDAWLDTDLNSDSLFCGTHYPYLNIFVRMFKNYLICDIL